MTLFVTDALKVHILRHYFEESTDILEDVVIDMSHPEEKPEEDTGIVKDVESGLKVSGTKVATAQKIVFEEEDPDNKRENAEVNRMDTFLRKSRLTDVPMREPGSGPTIDAGRRKSSAAIILEKRQSAANFIQPVVPATASYSSADIRRSGITRVPLLPNTPGSLAALKRK